MIKKLISLICITFIGISSYAHNSYLEYKSFTDAGSWAFCFDTGNYVYNASTMFDTSMPDVLIGKAYVDPSQAVKTDTSENAIITSVVGFVSTFVLGGPSIAIRFFMMIDMCTNGFVSPYYEQINLNARKGVTSQNNKWDFIDGYGVNDIPYRFQCNDPAKRGYDPKLCSRYPNLAVTSAEIDNIVVGAKPSYLSILPTSSSSKIANQQTTFTNPINDSDYNTVTLNPKKHASEVFSYFSKVYSYYRITNSGDKLLLCAGMPYLLFPIELGCTGVAPPKTQMKISRDLVCFTANTRMQYLLMDRTDLNSLGNHLERVNGQTSLSKFLQSSFHMTSTTVGAIKDLAMRAITNNSNYCYNNGTTFFTRTQKALYSISQAAITLYVAIIGFMLLTAPQAPRPGELIMMVIKLGLVVLFTQGDIWYSDSFFTSNNPNSATTTNKQGLYAMIMDVPELIGDIFFSPIFAMDPLQRCTLNSASGKITLGLNQWPAMEQSPSIAEVIDAVDQTGRPLTKHSSNCKPYPGGGTAGGGNVVQTAGAVDSSGNCVVQTTIWDAVDCKLANLLNLGSCNYSVSNLFLMWAVLPTTMSGIMDTGGVLNIVIAFCMITYFTLIFLVIFKYVHIFIISFFVITILVLLSPLFITFSLFKATSKMFQGWMTTLLGYTIYPGLLMAYLAIMFVTFDSLYFGYFRLDPNIDRANRTQVMAAVNQNCRAGNADPYCFILAGTAATDPCTINFDARHAFTKQKSFWIVNYTAINLPRGISAWDGDSWKMTMTIFGKMLLFGVLFFLFAENVAEILAQLSGIQGQSQSHKAMGSLNFHNATNAIGKPITEPIKFAAKKAFGFGMRKTGMGEKLDKMADGMGGGKMGDTGANMIRKFSGGDGVTKRAQIKKRGDGK